MNALFIVFMMVVVLTAGVAIAYYNYKLSLSQAKADPIYSHAVEEVVETASDAASELEPTVKSVKTNVYFPAGKGVLIDQIPQAFREEGCVVTKLAGKNRVKLDSNDEKDHRQSTEESGYKVIPDNGKGKPFFIYIHNASGALIEGHPAATKIMVSVPLENCTSDFCQFDGYDKAMTTIKSKFQQLDLAARRPPTVLSFGAGGFEEYSLREKVTPKTSTMTLLHRFYGKMRAFVGVTSGTIDVPTLLRQINADPSSVAIFGKAGTGKTSLLETIPDAFPDWCTLRITASAVAAISTNLNAFLKYLTEKGEKRFLLIVDEMHQLNQSEIGQLLGVFNSNFAASSFELPFEVQWLCAMNSSIADWKATSKDHEAFIRPGRFKYLLELDAHDSATADGIAKFFCKVNPTKEIKTDFKSKKEWTLAEILGGATDIEVIPKLDQTILA